jgi:acyl dehydratase
MYSAIGACSKSSTHLVELGAIQRFAEAVGDPDFTHYYDGATKQAITGTIVAPPTFSRSMRPSPAKPEFDLPFTGVLDGGSEWQYFLPIYPGENIAVTTKLIDLQAKSGTLGDMLLATRETVFVNEQGAISIRERDTEIYYNNQPGVSGPLPGQSVIQNPTNPIYESRSAKLSKPHLDNIIVGTELPILTKRPTIRQLAMYAGASGDFYEIHYDRDFANARGLNEVIVHGALKSAFLGQLLTDWVGDSGDLVRLNVKYRAMDERDRPLYCTGVVTDKRVSKNGHLVDCSLWIENDLGHQTTLGSATVALP